MADITLINDQNQDQTLSGVSKIVTRGTDGDVEFSVGGSCKDGVSWTVFSEQDIKIDGKSPNFLRPIKYTESPADVNLTVDIPNVFPLIFLSPQGKLSYTIKKTDTEDTSGTQSIENFVFTATKLDEKTTRLSYVFSIPFDGNSLSIKTTSECKLKVQCFAEGASLRQNEGKIVLSGVNAARLVEGIWGRDIYPYINIYDMSNGVNGITFPNKFYELKALEEIYFPAGTIPVRNNELTLMSCPNLERLDYTKSTEVQTCFPYICVYPSSYPKLKVYVPSSLYSQWIADKNWSKLADKIVAV